MLFFPDFNLSVKIFLKHLYSCNGLKGFKERVGRINVTFNISKHVTVNGKT